MAFNRSATTQAIFYALSDTPMTVHDLSEMLHVTPAAIQNSVATLLNAGECREVQVMGRLRKRMVRAFTLPLAPTPELAPPPERGPYTGEPRPLRYVPRDEPYISMLTQAGGA